MEPGHGAPPTLAVVVPTRNEADNVGRLISELGRALEHVDAEIIIVDDSDDETPQRVAEAAQTSSLRVGLIWRRPGERDGGLGGAVITGLAATAAPYVVVMDGDLQHPPELVPELLRQTDSNDLDLVLASRFLTPQEGGGLSRARTLLSRGLIGATRLLFPRRLAGVSDPLTGFFCIRRRRIDLAKLHCDGFKILLAILLQTPGLRVGQTPFVFGRRAEGTSKASMRELGRYGRLLLRLRVGTAVERFGRFGLVGLTGLIVNTAALALFVEGMGLHYLGGAILATQVSTIWNFVLTDRWVFRGPHKRAALATRFLAFAAMNNLALLLRGPMLVVLTEWLGIEYLASNVISLCALTLLRFAVADRLIWAPKIGVHHYNVHGLVTLTSAVRLPELERFGVEELAMPAQIQIVGGNFTNAPYGGQLTTSDEGDVVAYREPFMFGSRYRFQPDGPTLVEVSGLVCRSPHVLYTNVVEPLLRWTLAERGYALVHAACVTSGDRALLITARTDTGKTTTVPEGARQRVPVRLRRPTTSRCSQPDGTRAALSEAAHDLPAHAARRDALEPDVRRADEAPLPGPAALPRGPIDRPDAGAEGPAGGGHERRRPDDRAAAEVRRRRGSCPAPTWSRARVSRRWW